VSGVDVGRKYSSDTIIPPVAEHTRYVAAGAIAIGVERRVITEDIVMANLNAHGMAAPPAGAETNIADDGGVSLHVCDGVTHVEYLRFDMFDGSPHYHYIAPGEYQINIPYDVSANGDMVPWALRCIRERLPQMLTYCGAVELAAHVDRDEIEAALPSVVDLVGTAPR
jgi:hypothetical protein